MADPNRKFKQFPLAPLPHTQPHVAVDTRYSFWCSLIHKIQSSDTDLFKA